MKSIKYTYIICGAASLFALSYLHSKEADWTGFRGLERKGLSPDTGLLKKWPAAGPKQLWVYKNAGIGYSGPAIVEGKLYTLGERDGKVYLICLDANTGNEVYAKEFGDAYDNNWGGGPRSTPTVDGDLIYALGSQGEIVCAKTADGAIAWRKKLTDFGGKVPNWGYCESPLIEGDAVITTPGGAQGAMLALNKKTGATIWQSADVKDGAHYSTTIAVNHNGARQLIHLFEKSLVGVDAKDGKLLWRTEFPGKVAVIPTPIFRDGYVFVTAGYNAGCKMVKIGEGNKVEEVYTNDKLSNHHGGVILVGDHLYGHSDKAGWTCQDFKSGEQKWADRKALKKGAIGYADGMIYCLDEEKGTVALAAASPEGWQEGGRFTLEPQTELRKPAGRIWTHPVILNGKLYLRDQDLVYCYDVKG